MALKKRGVEITSRVCGVSKVAEETGDHILARCPLARAVIQSILHWCALPENEFHSVWNIIDYASK